ncbi:MAG: Maf family protein [Bacilli bacterium]|nr:Maf family protein [Bacilli bacterium]
MNDIKVILASSSKYRRRQMIDANIPFEVVVPDVDETPNESLSYKDQLADIAMRKANKVLNETKEMGLRLIIAADQNMYFNGKMYQKPVDEKEAREFLYEMMGSKEIYAYTGNAILLVDNDKVLQTINITDQVRMSMDNISDEEIDNYIKEYNPLDSCGAIVFGPSFFHLEEGRMSTLDGLTLEYAIEMLKNIK